MDPSHRRILRKNPGMPITMWDRGGGINGPFECQEEALESGITPLWKWGRNAKT